MRKVLCVVGIYCVLQGERGRRNAYYEERVKINLICEQTGVYLYAAKRKKKRYEQCCRKEKEMRLSACCSVRDEVKCMLQGER
jgi:hypothetical protein